MLNLIDKNKDKEKCWADKIKEWRKSGLSITTYCGQNDLNNTTFHKWKNKLSLNENKNNKITVGRIPVKTNPIVFNDIPKGIPFFRNEFVPLIDIP